MAQHFSSKTQIPWVSTDTLECIIRPYLNTEDLKNKFPVKAQRMETNDEKYSNFSSEEIISAYREQSKTAYDAIDMFALCEITDGHDFIIEGYHITPELVDKLTKKHPENIRGVFVIKTEMDKFVENIKKSSTPNDWIIRRTKNEETYWKIAKTICEY